jgi:hypothetical protein
MEKELQVQASAALKQPWQSWTWNTMTAMMLRQAARCASTPAGHPAEICEAAQTPALHEYCRLAFITLSYKVKLLLELINPLPG